MMDLLEGQRLAVALAVVGAFALGDARREVVEAGREMAVAPAAVVSAHGFGVLLAEAGAYDIVVGAVVVVVSPLVGPPSVPHPSVLIAAEVKRVVDESCVALVFCGSLSADGVVCHDRIAMEDDDAGEGIRTVHQRGGAFDDLGRGDPLCVDLHAVLGPPLVTLLAYAVVDDDEPVEAEATDHGF